MGSPSDTDYGMKAKRGARWAFIEVLVSGLVQAVRVAILARFFIPPADFGFVALANSAVLLVMSFAALGTVPYIVFRTDADRRLFSGIYWLTVLAGVLSCLVTIAAADVLATALGDARLALPICVLSLVLIVDSIGSPIMAAYVRDFSFRRHAIAEASSTLVGTVATFVLAAYGETVWALVLGVLIQRALRAIIALAWGYNLIGLQFEQPEAKAFAKFSGYTIAERFTGTFNERIPYIFLGWYQSEAQVGIFAVTSSLIAVPLQYAMNIALTAVTPVFARLQKQTGRLSEAYFLSLELVMSLVAPAFLGLMAVAPLLTPLVLGPQWAAAAPTLQYMCITFTIHAVYYFSSGLTLGTGHARSAFVLTALQAPGTLVVAYYGARLGGAEGVAMGQALVSAATIVPYYFFVTRPILGPCARAFVASLLFPLGTALAMAVIVMLLGTQMTGWRALAALPIQITVGITAYGALLMWFRPRIARELWQVLYTDMLSERLHSMRTWLRPRSAQLR